jgi:hypothetical protein
MTDRSWPIIIGGCHRSGTSLVRRILDSHSRIHCGPEVKFFKDWNNDYLNDPIVYSRFFASARAIVPELRLLDIVGRAFVEIHERAAELSGKSRWADKNPENVIYLAQWGQLLGQNWLFIHVVRNPLDTIASIAEARFSHTIPEGIKERVEHFRRYSQSGLDFETAYPERYHRIVYEQLVKSPATEIAMLMEWLGEEIEPAQINFNSVEHQAGLEDPKIRHTRGFHSESIDRWKSILKTDEIVLILRETRSLWRELDSGSVYPLDGLSAEPGVGW